MNMIHLADLHIGRYFNGVSLLEDQKEVLQSTLKTIAIQKPHVVIVAGDIYDRSIPREDAVEVCDWFFTELVKLGSQNILITGNHDSHQRVGFLNSLLEEKGLMVEHQVKKPLRCITLEDEFGPVDFYLFPYRDTANLKTIYGLETLKDDTEIYKAIFEESIKKNNHRKVLIYHGFVSGSRKEEMVESESERTLSVGGHDFIKIDAFKDFDYVALGHLHKPQWVVPGKIRYSGSPLKYSFSEENHEKSVSLVNLDKDGSVTVREIPLTSKRDVVTVEGTFSQVMNMDYDGNLEDYLRVVLRDREEILEPMMRLRRRFPNILELQRKRDEEEILKNYSEYKILDSKDMTSLFKDFYKLKNDADMTTEQLEYVKKLAFSIEGGE